MYAKLLLCQTVRYSWVPILKEVCKQTALLMMVWGRWLCVIVPACLKIQGFILHRFYFLGKSLVWLYSCPWLGLPIYPMYQCFPFMPGWNCNHPCFSHRIPLQTAITPSVSKFFLLICSPFPSWVTSIKRRQKWFNDSHDPKHKCRGVEKRIGFSLLGNLKAIIRKKTMSMTSVYYQGIKKRPSSDWGKYWSRSLFHVCLQSPCTQEWKGVKGNTAGHLLYWKKFRVL